MVLHSSKAFKEIDQCSDVGSVRKKASWVDLPKSHEKKDTTVLPPIEIAIGRIAMVAALLLFAGEMLTGKTFLEQVIALSNFLQ